MKNEAPETRIPVTAAEAERLLLQKLVDDKESPHKALRQLAEFYWTTGEHEKSLVHFRRLTTLARDVEEKAHCLLNMGQVMEGADNFPAAVRYYKQAIALKPKDRFVSYFLNNNLGFSLNVVGDFVGGERHCRKAIEIDPGRPNGHKNLGIALAGQGYYSEAAESFIAATQENALDDRAFHLLTQLLESHPDLEAEFGDVARLCGEAIKQARVRHTH